MSEAWTTILGSATGMITVLAVLLGTGWGRRWVQSNRKKSADKWPRTWQNWTLPVLAWSAFGVLLHLILFGPSLEPLDVVASLFSWGGIFAVLLYFSRPFKAQSDGG